MRPRRPTKRKPWYVESARKRRRKSEAEQAKLDKAARRRARSQ